MALQTITEADKYSRTTLLRGIVETIISVSPVLNLLPFDEILGNSLTYNRESTLAGADWYNPGDTWAEQTPVVAAIVAKIKVLGGDADVDSFLKLTRSNEQDLKAAVLALKAKAVARAFEDSFIYGDEGVNAKQFNGLQSLITTIGTGQQVNMGSSTTGAAMTFTALDQALDKVPGKADCLIMSRQSKRKMQKLARAQGWHLPLTDLGGALNKPVTSWGEVPIFISDFIVDTETIATSVYATKTGGACTSIFACRFGADGLHGLEAGGGIQVQDVGALETKDADRSRVKWYCGLALMNTVAIARVDGIVAATDWTN